MVTRRNFLKTIMVGGGAGVLAPSLFSDALASAAGSNSAGVGAPLLIVVQLSGGNDGLNMAVPLGNDDYYRARPKLAVAQASCLPLCADTGLHPSLAGLKTLYDAGQMTLLHGVGYPQANRSHFRSMEIWHTASDANRVESRGWLGRYFDEAGATLPPSAGICIGTQDPQAFAARTPRSLAFRDSRQLRARGRKRAPEDAMMEEMVEGEQMAAGDEDEGATAGASIEGLAGSRSAAGLVPLDFLAQVDKDAREGARQVEALERRVRNAVAYPEGPLAGDCALVGRLIRGDMPARVYYVSQGGFDTHANQAATHARLLQALGDALLALVKDLEAQGNLTRTRILVFSEFGRRVRENANGGTDHGAAGPVILLGGGLKGGVIGAYPALDATALDRGDIRHQVDFRSIYATLLQRHLGVPAAPVLGRDFSLLDC